MENITIPAMGAMASVPYPIIDSVDYGDSYYGEKAFWKMQDEFLSAIFGYTKKESVVLSAMLKKVHPRTNLVNGTIKGLARSLELDPDTVRSAISKMIAKNLLAPVKERKWMLNPRLLAKGYYLQEAKLKAAYDTCKGIELSKAAVIDQKTGELVTLPAEYATVEIFCEMQGLERFVKLYDMFFDAICGLSATEMRVLIYLIQAMDTRNNMYLGQMDKIAANSTCSISTVSRAMAEFVRRDIITKEFDGCWHINPKLIVMGNRQKTQLIAKQYGAAKSMSKIRQKRCAESKKERQTERD